MPLLVPTIEARVGAEVFFLRFLAINAWAHDLN